ncbi:MAG: protein phosphatase CheZ [Thermodesulfobacteriota bacterium]
MADKPEIFLEIGSGYFRIPTSEANYNITIIGSPAASSAGAGVPSQITPGVSTEGGDDYYQHVSEDLYQDIGQLAKSLSSTIMEIPAEDRKQQRATLDEAGDKLEHAKTQLRDIVAMTEKAAMEIMDSVEKVQGGTGDVQSLLSELKDHPAFAVEAEHEEGGEAGEAASLNAEIKSIDSDLSGVLNLLEALRAERGDTPARKAAEKVEKKERYLFDLDTIFQTLYELCTNETVKAHISGAREKAEEIFDLERFQDKISEKATGYEADDDNYFNVPMSDVFQSFFAACNDKGIKNLLKKMDTGQSTIFLDQAIPLEVPAIEEVELEGSSEAAAEKQGASVVPDPRLDEVVDTLQKCQEAIKSLPELANKAESVKAVNGKVMSLDDQHDIFEKIEAAFDVSTSITSDVSKITEALSFQDLSGQRIMKILKLLSDFQIELLAIVVSFGSQLKHKKDDSTISVDEGKNLAQGDVDKYLGGISEEGKDDDGMLDQETVNQMLEEFGF